MVCQHGLICGLMGEKEIKKIEKDFLFLPPFPTPFWVLYMPAAVSVEIALAGAGCAFCASETTQVWGAGAGGLDAFSGAPECTEGSF